MWCKTTKQMYKLRKWVQAENGLEWRKNKFLYDLAFETKPWYWNILWHLNENILQKCMHEWIHYFSRAVAGEKTDVHKMCEQPIYTQHSTYRCMYIMQY